MMKPSKKVLFKVLAGILGKTYDKANEIYQFFKNYASKKLIELKNALAEKNLETALCLFISD